MTKGELTKIAAAKVGVTQKEAAALVDALLDTVIDTLAKGERVQLTGFGTFEVRERSAHMGRDMNTLEPKEVPACRVVQFRGGKVLKDRVK